METLKQLMSLVDANSDKIPEGDYLAMCNALKEVHGKLRPEKIEVRSVDYYQYEDDLMTVTQELTRLHKERDKIHYRTKMTKHMKTDALREYAFREGLHSLREHSVEAFEEAGIRVNCDSIFGEYLEAFNAEVYEKKKALQLMLQEVREYRDHIVMCMAGELY